MRGLKLLLLAGIAACAAGAGATTYSFESPSEPMSQYIYGPMTDSGVTYNDHSGVSSQGSPFFAVAAPDGNQAAFLQSTDNADPGQVSIALTGLNAGGLNTLSFYLADRPGYSRNPVFVSFDGLSLGEFTPTGANFTASMISFAALATTGTLVFTASPTTDGDNDVNLDDVVVNGPPPTGGVPEPATWAMMLGGFGLVGAAVRRRGTATVTA